MDIEKMQNTLEKIDMYRREEDILFDSIKRDMSIINYEYISKNQDNLEYIIDILEEKMGVFSVEHANNIKIIRDNIDRYIATDKKIVNMFDDIGGA